MQSMFYLASNFDGNIASWSVGKVTDMVGMFYFATAFNSDLSSWSVGAVTSVAPQCSTRIPLARSCGASADARAPPFADAKYVSVGNCL